MSDTSRVNMAVVQQKIAALEARVKTLENDEGKQTERYVEILQRLARLESRVGFMAAGIGTASGLAVSLISKLLM